MKKTALLILLAVCLYACRQNSGTTGPGGVQHDTLNSGNSPGAGKKDSVISNGEYIQYYANGVIKMRGMMKSGNRDGLWKSYYENGAPWSETTFKDGKKDGRTTTWYENEKKRYEGFYTLDEETGKWIFWDEKGNKATEKDYDKK
jgi:antitoxin component YwqK of YwqJK toxin-antitoxin module